ncbi:MAG: hypothetical protein LBU32_19535 [Clostridiales bacterium]|nr:hypothetical protein [Clostridiales bacterium]
MRLLAERQRHAVVQRRCIPLIDRIRRFTNSRLSFACEKNVSMFHLFIKYSSIVSLSRLESVQVMAIRVTDSPKEAFGHVNRITSPSIPSSLPFDYWQTL